MNVPDNESGASGDDAPSLSHSTKSNLLPHPCNRSSKHPSSLIQPSITCELKTFVVETLPAGYPYETYQPSQKTYTKYHIPFFQFSGRGPPPLDVGHPGDIFIDSTPGANALYMRSSTDWVLWSDPHPDDRRVTTSLLICHPAFVNEHEGRYLWCSNKSIFSWYSLSTIENSRRLVQRDRAFLALDRRSPHFVQIFASKVVERALENGNGGEKRKISNVPVEDELHRQEKFRKHVKMDEGATSTSSALSKNVRKPVKLKLLPPKFVCDTRASSPLSSGTPSPRPSTSCAGVPLATQIQPETNADPREDVETVNIGLSGPRRDDATTLNHVQQMALTEEVDRLREEGRISTTYPQLEIFPPDFAKFMVETFKSEMVKTVSERTWLFLSVACVVAL